MTLRKYFDTVYDNAGGRPSVGAQVRVYITQTATMADLFADDEVTPISQPVYCDERGFFQFNVAEGTYDLVISKGTDSIAIPKVQLSGGTPGPNTITTAMLQNNAVTLAKLATIAAGTILGNNGVSPASPLALTVSSILTMLGAGAVSGLATLDSGGKVPTSQLPAAVLGALKYQGTWNANTNTPTLTNSGGGGSQGFYYLVSVAGNTTIDGHTDWQVGDWIVNDGSVWEKVDSNDLVTSVFGLIGAVSIDGLTAETVIADDDEFAVYSPSLGGHRKVTKKNVFGAAPLTPRSFSTAIAGAITWRTLVDIGASPASVIVAFGSGGNYAQWDPTAGTAPTTGTVTGMTSFTITAAVYDALANRIYVTTSAGGLWSINPGTMAGVQIDNTITFIGGAIAYCAGHNQFVCCANGGSPANSLHLYTCSNGSPDAPSRADYRPQVAVAYEAVAYDAVNDVIYALRGNDSGSTLARRLYRVPRSSFNSETHVDSGADNITQGPASAGNANRLVIAANANKLYTAYGQLTQVQFGFDISAGTPTFIALMRGMFSTASKNQGMAGLYLNGYMYILTAIVSGGLTTLYKLDPTTIVGNHPAVVNSLPVPHSPTGSGSGNYAVDLLAGNDGFLYSMLIDASNCLVQLNP